MTNPSVTVLTNALLRRAFSTATVIPEAVREAFTKNVAAWMAGGRLVVGRDAFGRRAAEIVPEQGTPARPGDDRVSEADVENLKLATLRDTINEATRVLLGDAAAGLLTAFLSRPVDRTTEAVIRDQLDTLWAQFRAEEYRLMQAMILLKPFGVTPVGLDFKIDATSTLLFTVRTVDEPASPFDLTGTRTLDEVLARAAARAEGLKAWLAENAGECSERQAHLDAGSVAQKYWHHGYCSAITDLLRAIDKAMKTKN